MWWLQLIGAALSMIGSYKKGKGEKDYYDAVAQEKRTEAASTQEQAKSLARIIRKAGKQQSGETTAALAKAGLDVNSSTAQDILGEVDQNVEADAMTALLTGERQARTLRNEAAMAESAGKNAKDQALLSMGQTGMSAWGNMSGGKS
jgi:hypothetical protein